jgi:hypothetical protein
MKLFSTYLAEQMTVSGIGRVLPKKHQGSMRRAKRTGQYQRAKAKTLCKAGCSLNVNPKAIATVQSG